MQYIIGFIIVVALVMLVIAAFLWILSFVLFILKWLCLIVAIGYLINIIVKLIQKQKEKLTENIISSLIISGVCVLLFFGAGYSHTKLQNYLTSKDEKSIETVAKDDTVVQDVIKTNPEKQDISPTVEEKGNEEIVEETIGKTDETTGEVKTEPGNSEVSFKIIDYYREDNSITVVTAPTHAAVRNATAKILTDKSLKIKKITDDEKILVINFFTDEKAAKISLENESTSIEIQYWEEHYYGQYSYSIDPIKYPPSIRIFKYVDHAPQTIEQIEP